MLMAVMVPREKWSDERLDGLDRKVDDGFARGEGEIRELRQEMNHRFDRVDERFRGVDIRFDAVDKQLETIDSRLNSMDQRFNSIDVGIEALNQRLFMAAVAVIVAMIGAAGAIVAAMIGTSVLG